MAGINDVPFIRGLAVPSVSALILFLGYFSQLVLHFSTLDPGPPTRQQSIIFNSLLALLWLTYYRAITVDPGRYVFDDRILEAKGRWCNNLAGLISLAILSLICFLTSLALLVMLVTSIRSWVLNQTMIEGWEQERHEAIADRGGKDWWDVVGPDGEKFRFEKLEFPYDVGFFKNMSQAMGTSNVLLWLWPLAGNPKIAKDGTGSGWEWEENGFNRVEGLWPPLDPEKIRRSTKGWPAARRDYAEELRTVDMSPEDVKAAFQKRQAEDERRKRTLLAELEEMDDYDMYNDEDQDFEQGYDGKPGWTNSDGDRLRDYGVDDESYAVIEDDDEDVPLAELMRRRKVLKKDGDDE
ncbi:hypothetical protein G7Z17_g7716 [Cylindrodendrum hubeiense]|uniref:Palmitoyltransferase PFA4 n=1 Tax=Cylindrodendrum hubeiense TaxID=595255 RepID=A0A9P5H2H3_9HYPO|nr:hypothetical protein G7Z17_g7716 [Cylindrodendrum hubeiense]